MFIKLRENKAFTLVEIMIVVAIIGLLIAIALPNFLKARDNTRKGLCANKVRLIGSAVEQEMIGGGTMPTTATLAAIAGPYLKDGVADVVCPTTKDNTYTVTGQVISCTNHPTNTYSVQPTT